MEKALTQALVTLVVVIVALWVYDSLIAKKV